MNSNRNETCINPHGGIRQSERVESFAGRSGLQPLPNVEKPGVTRLIGGSVGKTGYEPVEDNRQVPRSPLFAMSFQNAKIIGCNVDSDAYHKTDVNRGDPAFPVSPSVLKDFRHCPQRWFRGYKSPDSEAKAWGRLVDCLRLTGDQFADRYAVKPATYPAPASHQKVKKGLIAEASPLKWNANAAYCKDWEEKQEGREMVSMDDYQAALESLEAMERDDDIREFMDICDKQVMVVGEWHDSATGLTIPVKCLIDLAPRKDAVTETMGMSYGQCLGDLKTARSAAVIPFNSEIYNRGYHVQGAFDLDLWSAATGEMRDTWCFIVQENYAPWQTAKRILSQAYRDIGRRTYQQALAMYCRCLKSGHFPDYDETDEASDGWTICEPSPWMDMADQFSPQFETETEDKEEFVSEMPS